MLLVLTMGLGACSTDNEDEFLQEGYSAAEIVNTESVPASVLPSCFTSLTARVRVDVSNGIGNPVVVFIPVIAGTISEASAFKVRVEVQPLADCDDFESNSGTPFRFGPTGTVQNVVASPPSISVMPANMPLCYKWRFIFEGVSGKQSNPACYSTSIWYESPLF